MSLAKLFSARIALNDQVAACKKSQLSTTNNHAEIIAATKQAQHVDREAARLAQQHQLPIADCVELMQLLREIGICIQTNLIQHITPAPYSDLDRTIRPEMARLTQAIFTSLATYEKQ